MASLQVNELKLADRVSTILAMVNRDMIHTCVMKHSSWWYNINHILAMSYVRSGTIKMKLTQCAQVTPYGTMKLSFKHWFRQWLVAWQHQAITYYLNQYWLIIKDALSHSPESNFTEMLMSKTSIWRLLLLIYFLNNCHISQGPVS